MKNFRLCFLTAVLVITAFVATGARAFADLPQLSNTSNEGSSAMLYSTFNSMFGLGYTSNTDLLASSYYIPDFSGTFNATGTQIYLLSASSGVNNGYGIVNSSLTVFGSSLANDYGSTSIVYTGYTALPALNDFLSRQIMFNNPTNSGVLNLLMTNSGGTYGNFADAQYYSNPSDFTNSRDLGVNHFIYFDVTQLMLANFNLGFTYSAAYLVGYEEAYMQGAAARDFDGDYNDAVFLVFVGTGAPGPNGVPEPATLLLWTLGGLGMAGASWRRNRNRK